MIKFPNGYGLGYGQKLYKTDPTFKSPMLVVGANNYMREKISADLLKAWDTHLLFFPTSEATWRIGLLCISRTESDDNTSDVTLIICEGTDIEDTLNRLFINTTSDFVTLRAKAIVWLNHSVYKCPKLSFRDLRALEAYKQSA